MSKTVPLWTHFVRDLYAFVKAYGEFELTEYQSILERNGIRWDERAMTQAPSESLDAECIPALLLGAVRADRFSDGALLSFIQSGSIEKWLKQLDKQNGIERC